MDNIKISMAINRLKQYTDSNHILSKDALYHKAIAKLTDEELHVEIRVIKSAVSISTGFHKATVKQRYCLNSMILAVSMLLELKEISKNKKR